MTAFEVLAITLAGLAAGMVNAVVGSGTLITFPALVALGFDPLVANISNNIGLVPGSVAGALGYREELSGESARLVRLTAAAATGGIIGALLLLWLPPGAFKAIVPVFIALSTGLVAVQPRLSKWLAERRASAPARADHELAVLPLIVITGAYGGYFGAGQGILYIALLGIALPITLQRANAMKNAIAGLVNLTAGVLFVVRGAPVDWAVVGLIAVGATLGGQLGARFGRRLSAPVLRGVIVSVGVVAFWSVL